MCCRLTRMADLLGVKVLDQNPGKGRFKSQGDLSGIRSSSLRSVA